MEPPDPDAPGMFVLADPERLRGLLDEAGFVEVTVDPVELVRPADGVDDFLEETLELSQPVAEARARLSDDQWAGVVSRVAELIEPFRLEDGSVSFPACSLAATASS
jgi:hypothetical protein